MASSVPWSLLGYHLQQHQPIEISKKERVVIATGDLHSNLRHTYKPFCRQTSLRPSTPSRAQKLLTSFCHGQLQDGPADLSVPGLSTPSTINPADTCARMAARRATFNAEHRWRNPANTLALHAYYSPAAQRFEKESHRAVRLHENLWRGCDTARGIGRNWSS